MAATLEATVLEGIAMTNRVQEILMIAKFAVAAVAIAASTVTASAITFTDGTFSDVSVPVQYNSDPTGTTVTISNPCSSCGNPAAGLGVFVDYTNSSLPSTTQINTAVGFIENAWTYNPATQGAISSITASADKNLSTTTPGGQTFGAGSNTFHPMIVQDGNYYLASIPGPTVPEPGSTGWNTLSQSALTASDFLLFNFATDTFGTTNPNFDGDAVEFGLAQLNGFFPGYTATADYDNLSIQIQSTPLPAALPLFAGGLGLIGMIGRRKKRQAAAA
jgi:hypothetical protein